MQELVGTRRVAGPLYVQRCADKHRVTVPNVVAKQRSVTVAAAEYGMSRQHGIGAAARRCHPRST